MGKMFSAGTAVAGIDTVAATIEEIIQFPGETTALAKLHEVRIGQSSDAGDADAEMLRVTWFLTTALGTTGTSIVGQGTEPGFGTALHNSVSAGATLSTALTVIGSEAFNVQAGWLYLPTPMTQLTVPAVATEGIVWQISGALDIITLHATVVWEEFAIT